jgi:hypothetical protein
LSGCIFDVTFGGKNKNSILLYSTSHGLTGALSKRRRILRFS